MRLINRQIHLLFLSFTLMLLSGCSSLSRQQSAVPEVYLSREVQWQLPGHDILPGQFQLTQSVQARYGDDQFDLLFQVEKYSDRLAMAALTPSGQQLVHMVYQHGRVDGTVSPLAGNNISLAYLVSDFLIAFGQEQALRKKLHQAGAELRSAEQRRVITHNNAPIITIDYTDIDHQQWPQVVKFKNTALGYELVIQTLNRKIL